MFKKTLLIALCVVTTFIIAGCSSSTGEKADIRGTITSVSKMETGEISRILVEGKLEQDTSFDKASISISNKTKIYDFDGKKVDADVLKEGMQVQATFEGEVAESYPVQAKGKIIRILK